MKRFLHTGLLFLACMLLFILPEPGILRNFILNGLLGAVLILIPLHMIFTDKNTPILILPSAIILLELRVQF